MQHYGLTLALQDDPAVIERYKREHSQVWPEVIRRLREIGVLEMRIFLLRRRLFMYMATQDDFDLRADFARLTEEARYCEWDRLMRSMQEPVPGARPGEWWANMEKVFDLGDPPHPLFTS